MTNIPGIWFPDIFEKVKSLPRVNKIQKFDSISKEDFAKFAATSTPIIIKNAYAVHSESKITAIIHELWADHQIEMRTSRFENPTQYMERKLEKLSVNTFLSNYWKKDNRFYAGNNPVSPEQLRSIGIDFPNFYPSEFFNPARMWLGPRGAVTHLHKDIPDNFALNYFGRKRWIIFSPADFPYLYMVNPTPDAFPDLGVSQVNVASPDIQSFPEFSKATPIELVLEPGEMLYLPAGWGHYVENLEDSLLFNFWLIRDKSPAVLGKDV